MYCIDQQRLQGKLARDRVAAEIIAMHFDSESANSTPLKRTSASCITNQRQGRALTMILANVKPLSFCWLTNSSIKAVASVVESKKYIESVVSFQHGHDV